MYISLFLLLIQLQSALQLTLSSSSSHEAPPIAKSGCKSWCGKVRIPYPFGIGVGCFHDESYEILCNTSFHPPKPFLHRFHLEVNDIQLDGWYSRGYDIERSKQTILVENMLHNICSSQSSHDDDVAETSVVKSIDLRGTPYRFSGRFNFFFVEGCGAGAVLKNSSREIVTGCASTCSNGTFKEMIDCHGDGCCQASLLYDYGLDFYEINFHHEALFSSQTCNLTAGLLDSNSLYYSSLSNLKVFSTVLEWNGVYTAAEFSTSDKFTCFNYSGSQTCQCKSDYGYEGNPYLGCQVVRECQKCKHGCAYNDVGDHYYCVKHQIFKPSHRAPILGFSISTGSVILLLVCYWLYRLAKRIKEIRQKAKFFKRNGGLLLQQHISSRDGIVDKTRIFGFGELEKATNSFSEDRILGQGGQGTVYKGMLVDGRIVAIKKSKEVDKSQLGQFINEMVILSLVNHRSVVKLLGCCLETEVPLLVYEYISNGTLYQHVHDPSEDYPVTWKMRLQIAAESASALSYLHSSSSAPIFHRDIKSSNILLDDQFRAKVSDFGISRAITIEQSHVTTCVQGTYGYLDPEYFQSNQFTEKSDVYSFGVVLAELITGNKSVYPSRSGGWISLATDFLFHMENSCLPDILDTCIFEEAKEEEIIAVANLVRQCLNRNGKQRPTMKKVAVLLDGIRSRHLTKPEETDCSLKGMGS